MVWVIPFCPPVAEFSWWLGTQKKMSGVDHVAQTRWVQINSPHLQYTCIHHRIQLAVSDMILRGWKPTLCLTQTATHSVIISFWTMLSLLIFTSSETCIRSSGLLFQNSILYALANPGFLPLRYWNEQLLHCGNCSKLAFLSNPFMHSGWHRILAWLQKWMPSTLRLI